MEPNAARKRVGGESRYMKTLKVALRLSGLWRSADDRRLNPLPIAIVVAHLSGALLGTVHRLLFAPDDLSASMEILMNLTLIAHSLFTYLSLVSKQPKIMRMLGRLEDDFGGVGPARLGGRELRSAADGQNVQLVAAIFVIIHSVHTSFIVVSKVYLVMTPLESKKLLFPVTVPVAMSAPVYYAVYALELVVWMCESLTHVTSITVFAGFLNILCAEFSALGLSFRQLASLARRRALYDSPGGGADREWIPGAHRQLHAEALLKAFVDQHNLLMEFHKDLQSTFELPILDMFINSQIMLCSSGFHIFKLYQNGAYEDLFKQFCMFSALISHEYVYFWFGSRLTSKVGQFREEVCACQWLGQSPAFASGYRIVLERIKRPVKIQAVVFPANLPTFTKCLQAAISYFNILLALERKQQKTLAMTTS